MDFGKNTENGACAQERPVVQSLMRGSVHLGSRASIAEPTSLRAAERIKKQTLMADAHLRHQGITHTSPMEKNKKSHEISAHVAAAVRTTVMGP